MNSISRKMSQSIRYKVPWLSGFIPGFLVCLCYLLPLNRCRGYLVHFRSSRLQTALRTTPYFAASILLVDLEICHCLEHILSFGQLVCTYRIN
jgi:hypothetical protein